MGADEQDENLTQKRLVWQHSIGGLYEPLIVIKLSQRSGVALSEEDARVAGRLLGWQHCCPVQQMRGW